MVRFAPDKFDLALIRGELAPPAPVLPVLAPVRESNAPGALAPATRAKVASYPTLEQAREAVTMLSAEGLPSRHVSVVDEGVRQPPALFTYARAAAQGAAAGAWVGLALGFLSGVVKIGSWHAQALGQATVGSTPFLWLALLSALAGALAGALLGSLLHALADANSDAEPANSPRPSQFDVLVDAEHAEGARNLLWLGGP